MPSQQTPEAKAPKPTHEPRGMFRWLLIAGCVPLVVLAFPTFISHQFANESSSVAHVIRGTWLNPSDTLTILLIIGGDVVAKALAQLAGPRIVPVAFSFGWIAYSFNTLMSVFGDGRLMLAPDYDAKLVNVQSGIWRDNHSWVLGRLLRDIEQPLAPHMGIDISVYRATGDLMASYDWCYISGVIVIVLQLGIAAIPCGLYGDWSILLVTGVGTLLALITGALPQWRLEKYPGRRSKGKVVALTGGNGSRNVIVLLNPEGPGNLDLEDLAAAQPPTLRYGSGDMVLGLPRALRITQIACVALALCWFTLLVVVTGLSIDPWFFLLVGGLGMAQNVFVAGAQRAKSIRIRKLDDIHRQRVMHALMDAEIAYPRLGKVLLSEFFNDDTLRDDEREWWDGPKQRSSHPPKEAERVLNADEDAATARREYRKILKIP